MPLAPAHTDHPRHRSTGCIVIAMEVDGHPTDYVGQQIDRFAGRHGLYYEFSTHAQVGVMACLTPAPRDIHAELPVQCERKKMCFSATASFVTAGLTGVVGIIALARIATPREIPLAAVPIFFAVQQGIEGSLWLVLPADPQGPVASALALAFLLFAEVVWPIFAPFAVWCIEPSARRRHPMAICIVVGLSVGLYLLWWILTHTHSAAVIENHINYVTEARHSDVLGVAYLVATCLPMLCSSRRTLIVLGAIVLTGSVTAHIFYWEAFTSVWCFFAAAASIVILAHFEGARRNRLRVAGAW